MIITPEQARKILVEKHSFSQLGFSMLLTRLKAVYANDPSQDTLQYCTGEINVFLEKFAGIMGQDCAKIDKL